LSLTNLDADGEFIGRATQSEGITLRIDETFPGWETVSRRHARIYRDPSAGHVVIEDLGSQNGVYVEGRRTIRNLLKDGWAVAIGGVEFVYREPEAGSDQPAQGE
jgi:pSer/pThr/pTyr-binding forkhead associated (FHA) protein